MNKIELFKQKYIQKIITEQGAMDDELNDLFEFLLVNEFNNNPENMGDFIRSIVEDNTEKKPSELDLLKEENKELKQRQEMTEEALLVLSDMLLSR
ncbi:hypothetical protein IGJ74_001181 [Enterococcus sp. AZ009]|uniref:hypothetical protein n=1 Tax=Enterococcus sp. AZ009 TaxID=2774766 RepID=UPI003D2FFFFF